MDKEILAADVGISTDLFNSFLVSILRIIFRVGDERQFKAYTYLKIDFIRFLFLSSLTWGNLNIHLLINPIYLFLIWLNSSLVSLLGTELAQLDKDIKLHRLVIPRHKKKMLWTWMQEVNKIYTNTSLISEWAFWI